MSVAPPSAQEFSERAIAALERRDVDAFLELVHPEAEFRPLLAAVDGGVYVGHDAVRRWLDDLWDAWEGYRATVLDVDELSDRVAVVEILIRLRGHGSKIELETHAYGVSVRDESRRLIAAWSFYETAEAAREAALAEVRSLSEAG